MESWQHIYGRLVQDCNRKYKFVDVYSHEEKFRTKLACIFSRQIHNKVDAELFTTLDATEIKQGSLS